ncbi:MAG TPA: Maf family protein [Anaerohalosphaeraceae bacterium]|jgi:septum formation protein|nr:Maf family protein [Anaerohalosphaeraceae bacterium]HRT49482.1 Maf family protein [Anaerohalosphaeraceae bacterium]HRT85354.1 Maf family protein [Anaerohalosphaeraceae bacterium]
MNHTNPAAAFILASASPRRKLLLEQDGYVFDVIPSEVDESNYPATGLDSVEHTRQLALAKAKDIARRYPDRLVLAADTVVDFDGQIIGKPVDAADAERIVRMLFSTPHKVITGLALVRLADNTEIVEAAVTTIYPRPLTEEQIAEHIRLEDWKGKAGAYGIQESGDEFVERIEGSFTNVIGLPMELTRQFLSRFNITPDTTA